MSIEINSTLSALKQALEALQYVYEGVNNQGPHTGISWRCVSNKTEPVITSLRQAIDAAEQHTEAEKQEPVAYMYPDDLEDFKTREMSAHAYSLEMVSPTQGETVPLYTHPQPKQPLTDDEIAELWLPIYASTPRSGIHKDGLLWWRLARAIEAAHGIKGEA